MRIPLAGQIRTRDGTSNKNSRLTNALVEEKKSGVTVTAVRPGLNTVVTGSGNGNNIVCFNDNLVNIFGTDIKRVTSSGGVSFNDPNSGIVSRNFFWEGYGAYVDHLIVTKGAARYTNSYTPSCPIGASDPLWGNVVLYLDFEGANGSTTITDAKGHSINNSGPLTLSTSQYSCGTSSLYLNSGQLSLASYSSDFDLGTGDFCIETKFRFFDIDGYDWGAVDFNPFIFFNGSSQGYAVYVGASGGEGEPVDTFGISNLTGGYNLSATIDALANNVWYGFAVSRESGIIRLFKDGDMIAEEDTNTYSLTSIGTMGAGFYDTAYMP